MQRDPHVDLHSTLRGHRRRPELGVIGAVIDVLERRDDVDGSRVGVVGQSLGALYAPANDAPYS